MSKPFRVLRVLLVLAGAGALAWLTIGLGFANMVRAARPGTALAFFPFDARAKANVGERGSVELVQSRHLTGDIEQLARSALARDPTIADGWRLMGVIKSVRGDDEGAARTLRFAERISRRDLPVQLWLIEERVRRDDIVGALRHYDIALRTSPVSRQLLFPIMVAASAEPNVARPLSRLLASDPPWRREFAAQLTHSTVTGGTLPPLVAIMAGTQVEREIMAPMVQRLVTARDYSNAWQVYRLLKQAPPGGPEPLRDGSFEGASKVAPFDWFMANEGAIRGERRVRDGGEGTAFFISAEGGTIGEAGRQLLLLQPGSYQLNAAIGSVAEVPAAGVDVLISCPGQPARTLGEGRFVPPQPRGSRFSLAFTVPGGCPAQMLSFGVRSSSETGASEAWIDNVSISRR